MPPFLQWAIPFLPASGIAMIGSGSAIPLLFSAKLACSLLFVSAVRWTQLEDPPT